VIADLHAHYPMRVLTDMDPDTAAKAMKARGGATLGDRIKALVLRIANKLGNQASWDGTYRIDPEKLQAGNVRLAMSVLIRPFEEMDLGKPYAAPPDAHYFPKLIADLEAVEREVAGHDPAQIRLVHNRAELDDCLENSSATALVHSVEGGCLLGDTPAEIESNCAKLAAKGVSYVTVAHLFFRQVATNANALPFAPDFLYDFFFPQRGKDRLTVRGEALIRGMVRNRIMIDLSHMDPPAIRETFALLDEIDPEGDVPVISTHAGFRFGKQEYMLDEGTLLQLKLRRGVVGLIMAQHQLNDGLRDQETDSLEESMEVIYAHIDEIAKITEGYEQIALGTDFDGFIKPTMGGLENAASLTQLEAALVERYGAENAERMTWSNALGVLQRLWPSSPEATARPAAPLPGPD
jgi:microsomal dipeptidase-like Zn-dependent dipeptidase